MKSPQKLSVREGYAAWAPCYDDDGNPLVALEGPAVWAWLGPVRGRRAIDVGCGTGRHTLALAEAGAQVVALDQSPEMLERACRKLRHFPVDWIRHALPWPLPLRDSVFTVAVLGLVAEHVADLQALMDEVARVLVPGGTCVLSALHPERTAAGETARFIDPETGLRRPIVTYHRTTAEYLSAAKAAGLADAEEQTLVVPPELAERLPRAKRYVGHPLGWVARWTKPVKRHP